MRSREEEIQRIIAITEERGEFVTLEDGYVYLWPDKSPHGTLSSWHLRVLADELDRRNAGWEAQINADFEAQEKKSAHRLRRR